MDWCMHATKIKVMLIRNATLGPRTWEHTNKVSALSRAHALCKLHGVPEATWNDLTLTFTVDASAFYGKGI